MTWAELAPYILKYGLPFAEKLWQKITTGAPPTQADWDELKALGQQTPVTQMVDALNRAGTPLDSDTAKALIALVTPKT